MLREVNFCASYMIMGLPMAVKLASRQRHDHNASKTPDNYNGASQVGFGEPRVGAGALFACLKLWNLIYD